MDDKKIILERKARIFNIQKYNVYDGPGIRTLIFFQGCPLRCKWCSNPEGLEKKYRVMFKSDFCVSCGECAKVCPVGIFKISSTTQKLKIDRSINCIGCNKCVDTCLKNALSVAGGEKTISELMEIIREDIPFYETSGGGVTIGGGEVLMQPETATNLLMACKREGINTAIETSGYAKTEDILKVAENVDLFLFDLKQIDSQKHFQLTGVYNEQIIANLKELLERRYNVQIRMPLLKGVNDSKEEIKSIANLLKPYRYYKNLKGIHLLPYHKLGVNKYAQLNIEYPVKEDVSLTGQDLAQIKKWIEEEEIDVMLIQH